jgi:membrane dipeptidase
MDAQALDRIDRLHAAGLIDMHFDLLMDLYEKRSRTGVLDTDYWPDFQAGQIGTVAVPIYIHDIYLPEMALRVALDQVGCLLAELERTEHFALCRTYAEIARAREEGKTALLLTMEGVEPLGEDINLLRVFYELGLRELSLTHSRRNAAGEGAVFAASGSSPAGLTAFGREVVRQCESLGIVLDLAHLNPAGFEEALSITSGPVIVSHTNVRQYYDIERNLSDAQVRMIGQRGGVIGVSSVFMSQEPAQVHLDRYVDHVEHVASLIGIDGVGLGFDFVEPFNAALPTAVRESFQASFAEVRLIRDLSSPSQTRNLTNKLIERGFSDEEIEKVLYRNWMRVLSELT